MLVRIGLCFWLWQHEFLFELWVASQHHNGGSLTFTYYRELFDFASVFRLITQHQVLPLAPTSCYLDLQSFMQRHQAPLDPFDLPPPLSWQSSPHPRLCSLRAASPDAQCSLQLSGPRCLMQAECQIPEFRLVTLIAILLTVARATNKDAPPPTPKLLRRQQHSLRAASPNALRLS